MAQRKAKRSAALVDLTLVNQSRDKLPKKFLNDWVNRIALELQRKPKDKRLKNLNWAGATLTIAFLPSVQARKLNNLYRDKDYATDVLSFSDPEPGALGELAICPSVLKRQAKEHGLSYNEELGYMVLHGMLHLLGFDHEDSKREAKTMFELQDTIFEKLRGDLIGRR